MFLQHQHSLIHTEYIQDGRGATAFCDLFVEIVPNKREKSCKCCLFLALRSVLVLM